jgi:hypothetical protein
MTAFAAQVRAAWSTGSGSSAPTSDRAADRGGFVEMLGLLDTHLATRPYLFGGRPAWRFRPLGQFYEMWTDPTAGALIGGGAPHVLDWVHRMLWPQAEGAFESWTRWRRPDADPDKQVGGSSGRGRSPTKRRCGRARKNSVSRSAEGSGPKNRKNITRGRSACCAPNMPTSPTSAISIWFWPRRVAWPDCAPRYLIPIISRTAPHGIAEIQIALIVGAGEGLSASLARLLAKQGIRVALAARQIEKLGALCTETGARAFACNATDADEVERLFGLVEREIGTPDVVVYNASGRARGAFTDLVPAEVAQAIDGQRLRRLLVAQQAAQRMLPDTARRDPVHRRLGQRQGYAQSAPFAMGKFALRGWRKAWRANCRRRASTSRIS